MAKKIYVTLCGASRFNRPSLTNSCSRHKSLKKARNTWVRYDAKMGLPEKHKVYVQTTNKKFVLA